MKSPGSPKPTIKPKVIVLKRFKQNPFQPIMTENPFQIPEVTINNEPSASSEPIKMKWSDTITPNKIISNLEKLVLSTTTEKAYNKAATEGISSSKRTLESLLARNGGQQNCVQNNPDQARINNKNYTLDANGRVCLVKKTNPNSNRTQELIQLEKETRSLRNLQKSLMITLELIMQDHRKMMVEYMDRVNEKPVKVPKKVVEKVVEISNDKLTDDFALMVQAMDLTLKNEEAKLGKRRRQLAEIELETFLMQALLEFEDIREVTVEGLVEKWRNRNQSKIATDSPQDPKESGDNNETTNSIS